jgi:tetratricopeptide (TPR) repeat protein
MSQSWRSANPIPGLTTSLPHVVEDRVTGYRYEVAVRGNELWQVETHAHDPTHRRERQAKYMVGSGHHAIAWVAEENDFLTELPVGWFGKSGWRMNPGYELKNHRFSRPITSGCVACHATGAVADCPTTNHFSTVESGIDCSRCHGDAKTHVAFWKSPQAEKQPPEARLVHPGHLPADRANDICLQCHLQGDVTVFLDNNSLDNKTPWDFQPGHRLRDERLDFLITGQTEALGIASHGARMLQSRCYVASGEKLTCIHCHDPHRPAASILPAQYDTKCVACHQPENCRREATADERRMADGCVRCHMPQRPTREGLHLVFTDHAIRRRPVALEQNLPSLLAANSDVELVSAWPGKATESGTLGAAYVVLHETMGPQLPSLQRGYELLSEAVSTEHDDISGRYWLGSAALALGRSSEALEQFRQVVAAELARHEPRYRLALSEEAGGNAKNAIEIYERLIGDVPTWPEPHSRLAQLYLSRQQPADASRVLRKLVSLQPSAAACASLALAERLSGGSHEAALAKANVAVQLDSRDPAVYITRATLQLLSNHHGEARQDFEKALKLDPDNATLRRALGVLSQDSRYSR